MSGDHPLTLVLASANPDKAVEIAAILSAALPVELVPRPATVPDVVEDGATLLDNARLKAVALLTATGTPAVADDTGLEVDALGGEPGVYSARYAGDDATYADNVAKLLRELAARPDGGGERRARFRTVALAAFPDGTEVWAEGTVEGTILTAGRGSAGFGYDPVFAPDGGRGRSFAEMTPAEKHAVSHRGRAFRRVGRQTGRPPVTPADNPLFHHRYPRSNAYEASWIFENLMGPHPLWLMESLSEVMTLTEGMRILDLGCGTALTSIFLAKEFGVHVAAADLWIDAAANEARVAAAGLTGRVVPVHAEAHSLPFAVAEFDAIVSVDAYHYFGTDDLYIGSITEYLRPGGQIGIVVPSVREELEGVPAVLAPYWQWDFCSFHSAPWWHRHWEKTGKVTVEIAETIADGWADWLRFDEASAAAMDGWRKQLAEQDAALLRADNGAHLCFTQMVGLKGVAVASA